MVMKSDVILNHAVRFIEAHIEEPITTIQIAREIGYSEFHFIRMFKACMGITVMEYITVRKLIKASEEILQGVKIIDVALKYGWQSHSGFTKAFKKAFGFYPSLLKVMIIEMDHLGGNAMNHVFLESTKIGATKEELFEILMDKVKEHKIELERETLTEICEAACKAYAGVKRYSGEEYVTHLLNVSIILAELDAESDVICAGMFCDVDRKGVVSLEYLKKQLPPDVFELVCKAAKAGIELSAERDDVILIKIAERLHNMRTIKFMDEGKKKEKAKETIEFFMPLVRKLGNKKLVDELNDLGMKYYLEKS